MYLFGINGLSCSFPAAAHAGLGGLALRPARPPGQGHADRRQGLHEPGPARQEGRLLVEPARLGRRRGARDGGEGLGRHGRGVEEGGGLQDGQAGLQGQDGLQVSLLRWGLSKDFGASAAIPAYAQQGSYLRARN